MKLDGRDVHISVTAERIVHACERRMDNPGICIACGGDADDCEPDARKYKCEICGEWAVYGAEELAITMM